MTNKHKMGGMWGINAKPILVIMKEDLTTLTSFNYLPQVKKKKLLFTLTIK